MHLILTLQWPLKCVVLFPPYLNEESGVQRDERKSSLCVLIQTLTEETLPGVSEIRKALGSLRRLKAIYDQESSPTVAQKPSECCRLLARVTVALGLTGWEASAWGCRVSWDSLEDSPHLEFLPSFSVTPPG